MGGVAWISLLLLTEFAQAQPATPHPLTPSDTTSPRATFTSFLAACEELHGIFRVWRRADTSGSVFPPAAERVLDCLDLSELPRDLRDSAGVESAVFLKEVIDRIDLPLEEAIPGAQEVSAADAPGTWRVPGTRLVIERTDEGPHRGEFRFSPETVRRAASFYKATRRLPYRDNRPGGTPGFHDLYIEATKRTPQQTADTASPRGTLTLFLGSANEIYDVVQAGGFIDPDDSETGPVVKQVVSCLDVSELPEYSRAFHAREAAVCLKEVLDRTNLPAVEDIPGIESLEGADETEKLRSWQIPNTRLTIARVQEGPRRGAYLFSPETVRRATEFFEKVRSQPYRTDGIPTSPGFHDWWLSTPHDPRMAAIIDHLPAGFQRRFLGLAFWQWLGVLIIFPVAIAVMYFAFMVGRSRSERWRDVGLLRYWATLSFPIVAMLVPLAVKYIAYEYLSLRGDPLYVVTFCSELVFLLALVIVVGGGCGRIAETIVSLSSVRAGGMDGQLIRIFGRVVGVVAAAVVFLEGGRYLGFPLTTLLASAGIGGLAIALAGQSMLKGLFGTLTIMLDKPFREGERIVVMGHDGFVEEIGLRSTKIRTFMTNHLVAIPNDQMADGAIENIGRRKHMRRMSNIRIPIDTPREKVELAVEAIRKVLDNHSGMDPEYPPRVYFNEINPDSFNILVIYWFQPVDLWEFHAFSERVNLDIFRLFSELGIQFSLPVRHSYWKRDDEQGPLDVRLHVYDFAEEQPVPGADAFVKRRTRIDEPDGDRDE